MFYSFTFIKKSKISPIIFLLPLFSYFILFSPVIKAAETTYYLGVIEKTIETGEIKSYLSAGNTVVVKSTKGSTSTTSYLYTDHLGSTVLVAKNDGTKDTTLQYYPYGSQNTPNPPSSPYPPTDKLYTSQRLDFSSNLYFYNARYYNPKTGNFISADQAQGPNRYAYVGNNPIMKNDPSGNLDNDAGAGQLRHKYLQGKSDKYTLVEKDTARWTEEMIEKTTNLLNSLPEKFTEGETIAISSTLENSIFSDSDLSSNYLGIYDYQANQVVLNAEITDEYSDYLEETIVHELGHAYIYKDKEKIPSSKKDAENSKFKNNMGETDYREYSYWSLSLDNSNTLKTFSELVDWQYDEVKHNYFPKEEPNIIERLTNKSNRYDNIGEEFVNQFTEFYFDKEKYQNTYGDELFTFFSMIYQ